MKRILVATALAVSGLVPGVGSACEYNDASASAVTPAQLGSAPAATRVATRTTAQVLAAKAAKPMADKTKPLATDRKLAVVTSN
jgi:hypothetical protein